MAWDEEIKMQAHKIEKSASVEKYENTKEFHVLKPSCVAIIQSPTESNFKKFQQVLSDMDEIPLHLAEYVLFPFALQLKMLYKYTDQVKISLFLCTADVLTKLEVTRWEMFIEMFQRLHLALGSSEDPTSVKPRISDDELSAISSCILSLVEKSLSIHFETLFNESKIQILAHSIVMLLQVVNFNTKKNIRLKAMTILEIYSSGCEDNQTASIKFYKFLPGIVTSLRKTVDIRAGRVFQEIVINGMRLMRKTVAVSVKYVDAKTLEQPDIAMSVVFSEFSKEMVLHENVLYRKSLYEFSEQLLAVIFGKMLLCQETLLNNLLILRNDRDDCISKSTLGTLENYTCFLKIQYEDLLHTLKEAVSQRKCGDDVACNLSLSKLSTYLTIVKLNFVEIREFLSIFFILVNETIKTCFSVITKETHATHSKFDPKLELCAKICKRLMSNGSLDDILEEFDFVFSNFDGNLESSFLGSVFCFNQILVMNLKLNNSHGSHFRRLSQFEILQFANYYVSIIDIQSTEIVLSVLEVEAPKIQSIVDMRKTLLLDGLGVMAKVCPEYVLPVVLYPLVEFAGLNGPACVCEAAQNSLDLLSKPTSVTEFLNKNISHVMNELSVRILNLSLHPNCPNALMYLAEHFDFCQLIFINLVDQVLSRSCDPFCGGHLQQLYVKVFYSFMISLWKNKQCQTDSHPKSSNPSNFLSHKICKEQTLLQRLIEYQELLNIQTVNENHSAENFQKSEDFSNSEESEDTKLDCKEFSDEKDSTIQILSAELNLAVKISHRVLNFLPSNERGVRLLGMDCLIKGAYLLKDHEDSLLPLAHTIWQNLTPRFTEKDYVVVQKAFELLLALCATCGTFLKKRIFVEVLPRLSTILMGLAAESGMVQKKNLQYYTFTQAFKLQATILKGMAELCEAIDIQEDELYEILSGCIFYLSPQQHKNLRDMSRKLIDSLTSGDCNRSVWMKLIYHGLRNLPLDPPHKLFILIPTAFINSKVKTLS